MFLGVTGHADAEIRVVALFDLAVDENASVHPFDLLDQLRRVQVSVRVVAERVFSFQIVSAERQHVLYSQEVQVDQGVFDVVARLAAADQVRDDGQAVPLHDGRRNADRPRPPAYRVPFEQTVFFFDVFDVLAVVGDATEDRGEFHKRVDRFERALCSVAFERRQQFERETGFAFRAGFSYDVGNVHEIGF